MTPLRVAPAPAGFDQTALMLMGCAARATQTAGALEAILDMTVRYANERVAFEKPIGKFQAVQHNLARLAGEVAAALTASELGRRRHRACDRHSTTASSSKRRRRKSARAEAAQEGAAIAHQVHGAIGFTNEHILHRYTLRLLALARRLRQRKPLGGRARQPDRGARRRRILAAGRGPLEKDIACLISPSIRSACRPNARRCATRCARSSPKKSRPAPSIRTGRATATRTNREFSRRIGAKGWIGMTWPKKYGGHERSFLERYVVTEEFRVANAPVRLHFVADRQSGPILIKYAPEHVKMDILPRICRGEAVLRRSA